MLNNPACYETSAQAMAEVLHVILPCTKNEQLLRLHTDDFFHQSRSLHGKRNGLLIIAEPLAHDAQDPLILFLAKGAKAQSHYT